MITIIGQILGWLSALLTFISYQCKEHKKLVAVQVFSTLSICISYMLLGAWSGMLLNVICIIRNFIILLRDTKIFSYRFWPYLVTGVMGVVGALSWQGPMSLLVIFALMANTMFLFGSNAQKLRKSILVTSTMVATYNVYYTVWGGVMNEIIAIVSSIIGIYRFRKTKE